MIKTSLQECIDILKNEKKEMLTARFPCRVILTHSRKEYQTFLDEMSVLCDRTVSLNELFDGADVLPAYDRLIERIKADEWVVLPGVSEYLRLFHDSEIRSGRFAKLWHQMVSASNKGRIIIPLWNCDSLWYDKALEMETDIRQDNDVFSLTDDNPDAETLNIMVFSSAFEEYIGQLSGKYTLIIGLREWYEHMLESHQCLVDYCLLTKQARTVVPVTGDITIRTIKDTYTFVRENLSDGYRLKQELCTPEILEELFDESLKNISLNEAIKNCFNIVSFDGTVAVATWNTMTIGKKQLLKLWYILNPDHSYLCMCLEKSEVKDAEYQIIHSIFDVMQIHPEWMKEYTKLLAAMKVKKDDKFFKQLDGIPVYEDRIPFLSIDTREERIYILRMVGQWMKQDAEQVRTSKALEKLYPVLYGYLQDMPACIDKEFSEYIFKYKAYKLSNTLPESEEQLKNIVNPESLPYRFAVLSQNLNSSTAVLWIDAMGFEYLSLLLWVLQKDNNGSVTKIELSQATLPTETKFNEQWNQMNVVFHKKDKLDKLAHKGVVDEPDYYTCIEEQIDFFCDKIISAVDELLRTHERVVITGDHGTSRLAARYFHMREGITPPPHATVYSHGRYCKIANENAIQYDFTKYAKDSDNNLYWVMSSYDHFTIGGFAAGGDDDNAIYGEVHGGASPEEMIVPVVVFDGKTKLPLQVKLKEDKVKLKRGTVKFELEFSKPVKTLQVKLGSADCECTTYDKLVWNLQAHGIAPDVYLPTIVADGLIVSTDEKLTVKSAIGGDGDI